MKKFTYFFVLVVSSLASCRNDKGPLPIVSTTGNGCDSSIHYSSNISAIISTKCSIPHCHNSGSVNGDFTNYSGFNAKVVNGSLHNRVVVLKDMPQAGSPQLTDSQIKNIDCWIQQGGLNN